jgi:hypothetical protein
MNFFYITVCGQMTHVLRVRVCSTFTTVTSGHRIILIPSVNIAVNHHLLLDRLEAQRYCDFLETIPPRPLEDVPLAVRQRLWFQNDRAPAYYWEDIQAGGSDVDGQLHGPFGHKFQL